MRKKYHSLLLNVNKIFAQNCSNTNNCYKAFAGVLKLKFENLGSLLSDLLKDYAQGPVNWRADIRKGCVDHALLR